MSAGEFDLLIIGGGPAGLAAALYGARGMVKTALMEKQAPGGQILLTDMIENYPGFPDGINPTELVSRMQKQAEKFGAQIVFDEAKKVEREGKFWKVEGWAGSYVAKALIIATGSQPRKLEVEGEKEFTGRGVSYCAVCDGPFFKNVPVAVVGGGDSALSEALFLTNHASKVYLIHRRQGFRAERIWQKRVMEHPKIELVLDTVVRKIDGDNKVRRILIENVKDGKQSWLDVEAIFIFIGMQPNSDIVKGVVELDERGRIKVNKKMETNQPGIFAAGDVCDIPLQQVTTAVGSAAVAAMSAVEYISREFGL